MAEEDLLMKTKSQTVYGKLLRVDVAQGQIVIVDKSNETIGLKINSETDLLGRTWENLVGQEVGADVIKGVVTRLGPMF